MGSTKASDEVAPSGHLAQLIYSFDMYESKQIDGRELEDHKAHDFRRPLVVMGGSAGGIPAVMKLLPLLPFDLPAPILIALHLGARTDYRSQLPALVAARSGLRVKWGENGEVVQPGIVYLAPQERHMQVSRYGAIRLSKALGRPRPSIDQLFSSAAQLAGASTIGVVLSGCLSDGALGARQITSAGGCVFVQDSSAEWSSMPTTARRTSGAAMILPLRNIAAAITASLMAPASRGWLKVHQLSSYMATSP